MKTHLLATTIALFIFSALAWATPADVTGVWIGQITGPNGDTHDLTFNLKADGNKVSGTISGGPPNGAEQTIVNGKVERNEVSFDVNTEAPDGTTIKLSYVGNIVENQIRGSAGTPMGSLPFTVKKK
jgi:hypothetical protein